MRGKPSTRPLRKAWPRARPAARTLEEVERRIVVEALERSGGNKTHAAAALGMSLATIKRRVKRYEITREEYDS